MGIRQPLRADHLHRPPPRSIVDDNRTTSFAGPPIRLITPCPTCPSSQHQQAQPDRMTASLGLVIVRFPHPPLAVSYLFGRRPGVPEPPSRPS
jgi:hypothetical protein